MKCLLEIASCFLNSLLHQQKHLTPSFDEKRLGFCNMPDLLKLLQNHLIDHGFMLPCLLYTSVKPCCRPSYLPLTICRSLSLLFKAILLLCVCLLIIFLNHITLIKSYNDKKNFLENNLFVSCILTIKIKFWLLKMRKYDMPMIQY